MNVKNTIFSYLIGVAWVFGGLRRQISSYNRVISRSLIWARHFKIFCPGSIIVYDFVGQAKQISFIYVVVAKVDLNVVKCCEFALVCT